MAKNNSLLSLLEASKVTLADLGKRSATWFETQARDFRRTNKAVTPEVLMRGDQHLKSNVVRPGDMLMFIYDAKHKDTLPFWDRFPLVFPFRTVPGGFYAMNLHYLPYAMRARLMDKLMEYSTSKGITEDTRLRLKWQTLSAFSQSPAAEVCVKHYLYSQVQTQFKKIPPADWAAALMLPVEQFQGASSKAVWAASAKTIRSK